MENFESSEGQQQGRGESRPPIVETKISKSKDGKWVMHRTIITDIKPATYYQAVLKSS